jgi:hypothetical protein
VNLWTCVREVRVPISIDLPSLIAEVLRSVPSSLGAVVLVP